MRAVAGTLYVLSALTMIGGLVVAYVVWNPIPIVAGLGGCVMVAVLGGQADWSSRQASR